MLVQIDWVFRQQKQKENNQLMESSLANWMRAIDDKLSTYPYYR